MDNREEVDLFAADFKFKTIIPAVVVGSRQRGGVGGAVGAVVVVGGGGGQPYLEKPQI